MRSSTLHRPRFVNLMHNVGLISEPICRRHAVFVGSSGLRKMAVSCNQVTPSWDCASFRFSSIWEAVFIYQPVIVFKSTHENVQRFDVNMKEEANLVFNVLSRYLPS